MESEFKTFVASAAAFMAAVLLLDTRGIAAQLVLGGATAVFVFHFCRRLRIPLTQIACCILIATTGEVLLSLVWGLYSYQHALIPLYVPPGHGLFYALALATSRQHAFRVREKTIVRTVIAAGSVIAAVSFIVANDSWGLLWWAGALALLCTSRNQLMLASCFGYTMVLEWAGTFNGNWKWAADVPGLGLHSANPPAGVGILYILLDLVVVVVTTRFAASREHDQTHADGGVRTGVLELAGAEELRMNLVAIDGLEAALPEVLFGRQREQVELAQAARRETVE